jgi:hypothetical protein
MDPPLSAPPLQPRAWAGVTPPSAMQAQPPWALQARSQGAICAAQHSHGRRRSSPRPRDRPPSRRGLLLDGQPPPHRRFLLGRPPSSSDSSPFPASSHLPSLHRRSAPDVPRPPPRSHVYRHRRTLVDSSTHLLRAGCGHRHHPGDRRCLPGARACRDPRPGARAHHGLRLDYSNGCCIAPPPRS